MSGTNYVRPAYPSAYFPTSAWDGLTENHYLADTDVVPDDRDYKRLAAEVVAMQQHMNALFSRTAENNFKLAEPVWDDLRFPSSALKLPTSNYPAWTDYGSGQVLAFSDQAVEGNEELIYFIAQLSHKYVMGTDLEVHVHWVGEDATAGNVYWKFSYDIAAIGDTFTTGTPLLAAAANGGADVHNYSDIGSIDMSAFTDLADVSIMIIGNLRRNSSHANDTFDGKDAYLLEMDFHYQIDKLGSSDEESHSE